MFNQQTRAPKVAPMRSRAWISCRKIEQVLASGIIAPFLRAAWRARAPAGDRCRRGGERGDRHLLLQVRDTSGTLTQA
jgi:hypothetical protein